jgi:ribosome biogenesis GTPase A
MFNKADLASDALRKSVLEAMKEREPHVTCLFASNQASGRTNAKAVLALVDKMPTRGRQFREAGTMMLVIGMSNVGKSSIINSLRNAAGGVREGKGAKTGAAPGITRSVSALCVRQSPPVYVYDTPGVVAPLVSSVDHGMKLLLCNILPEKIAPYAVQAEFLLHFFAQIGATKWADVLGLRVAYGPDDAGVCLAEVATKLQMLKPGGGPDLEAAGRHIVRHFQKGLLGKYTLDVANTLKPQPLLEDVVIC